MLFCVVESNGMNVLLVLQIAVIAALPIRSSVLVRVINSFFSHHQLELAFRERSFCLSHLSMGSCDVCSHFGQLRMRCSKM